VVVLRDITERREIERLRDDFVSTLTHDLRTPLLAAIQTLGFFADGSLGELPVRQRELITMLIQSHRDMLDLVNVLLEVYKYESGRQRLIRDYLNLWELLDGIVRELDALARSREQTLTLEPLSGRSAHPAPDSAEDTESVLSSGPFGLVYGDKQELKRVFVNLIGNAIHYTPVGGTIRVSLQASPEHQADAMLQVCVQDNGRGIPAQDIPLLFQRFSQGTSRQRSSGSGLGLYLSRQIVEAHHGRIRVESEENRGSRFYVQLPSADTISVNP
jgi:NtrC-family two-component system sensor histidine kinase KinB